MKPFLLASLICLLCIACKEEPSSEEVFKLMAAEDTHVLFSNDLPYTEEFNTYTYRNFYNGGGVALGDINNDGLVDIYFTGNIVDNKLFLNKGNWEFEDITETAGVACANVWSSGVSFVDINGDGLLDIYVCKAGKPGGENRHNELFINQGDLTFKEESKAYGLDVVGLSIHSAFFDYDKDGDLDCYLLNNSIRAVGGFDLQEGLRNIPDPEGNKLLRNDNGVFVDQSTAAGIYSSNIGYGLGITLGDFNQDQWTDIFISNDFFERDYLYINNQNGTFKEVGAESFSSMSMGSMGADACDIDNDLLPDLFVTEMLPHNLERKKTKAQYESWNKYNKSAQQGYHHQFSRNILQRNIGAGKFIELGRFSGVAATEWSWASLIQDFDNDGLKDLFVSNGIYKDLLDRDYLNYSANDIVSDKSLSKNKKLITTLVDSMPSFPVENFAFKNLGDFKFENVSKAWGLDDLTFSNGSAYGDLDNDGDLDLVVNNVNMPSFLYQNNTDTTRNRSIQFELIGVGQNTQAIGAKVIIKYEGGQAMYEHYTSKGFESTVDGNILFGVGNVESIDSAIVLWPNGTATTLTNLASNQKYTINEGEAKVTTKLEAPQVAEQANDLLIDFEHKDILLNIFSRERLLLEMSGFRGPAIATADVNGDSIDDVFLGGGKQQTSQLFLSQADGNYARQPELFEAFKKSEVVDAIFFDADNDGDQDLYVAHGGKSFSPFSTEMNDLLFINNGQGEFSNKKEALDFSEIVNTGGVAVADLNKDGLSDLVVTESMKNNLFGSPGSCFIFINKGNTNFELIETPALKNLGMISDVALDDMDDDGWPDIALVGKWMPLTILYSNQGDFIKPKEIKAYPNTRGLWNTLAIFDLDNDGDKDIVCGNEGLNNFYSTEMVLFINDFDKNGTAEQLFCYRENGNYFPVLDLDDLFAQVPLLKKKYTYYEEFAKASVTDLFGQSAIAESDKYELDELRSMVYLKEDAGFKPVPLPNEIQYSSVFAMHGEIENGKGRFYFGGNTFKMKPQLGRSDGSMGWAVAVKGEAGSELSFSQCKPLFIEGQIRSIQRLGKKLIFGINDEAVQIFENVYE